MPDHVTDMVDHVAETSDHVTEITDHARPISVITLVRNTRQVTEPRPNAAKRLKSLDIPKPPAVLRPA